MAADGVNGLPLKATGTVLDHRLCSQQSVYDARTTSRVKVRIHYIRDWVVDYAQPVTVWLITDWAWYRWGLLLPDFVPMSYTVFLSCNEIGTAFALLYAVQHCTLRCVIAWLPSAAFAAA